MLILRYIIAYHDLTEHGKCLIEKFRKDILEHDSYNQDHCFTSCFHHYHRYSRFGFFSVLFEIVS